MQGTHHRSQVIELQSALQGSLDGGQFAEIVENVLAEESQDAAFLMCAVLKDYLEKNAEKVTVTQRVELFQRTLSALFALGECRIQNKARGLIMVLAKTYKLFYFDLFARVVLLEELQGFFELSTQHAITAFCVMSALVDEMSHQRLEKANHRRTFQHFRTFTVYSILDSPFHLLFEYNECLENELLLCCHALELASKFIEFDFLGVGQGSGDEAFHSNFHALLLPTKVQPYQRIGKIGMFRYDNVSEIPSFSALRSPDAIHKIFRLYWLGATQENSRLCIDCLTLVGQIFRINLRFFGREEVHREVINTCYEYLMKIMDHDDEDDDDQQNQEGAQRQRTSPNTSAMLRNRDWSAAF